MKISGYHGTTLVLTGIVAGLLLANCSDRDSDRSARAAGLEKAPWNVRLRMEQATVPATSTNILTHSGKGGYLKAVIWNGYQNAIAQELTIQVDGAPPLTFDSRSWHFGTSESPFVQLSPFLRRLPIGEGIRFQDSLSIDGASTAGSADVTVVWGVDI